MAVADKTISFRAPHEFGERLDRSRAALHELRGSHARAEIDRWVIAEFDLALLRWLEPMSEASSQGAFVRTAMEALMSATERVQRGLERVEAYRAFAAEDAEGDAVRVAALAASADHSP